ncbi:Major Facilitator Superfamily protein [Actinoalloteichus hoggarensis]|uniref:Major Facilitator Superfamily protein n=2 Tax=Actinoalloteichus hoggarensis TaxID=1470176 RepID=A0A221VXW4_9PSEU|nr:Major Facilitator Superfamily protein [Actinoalloteichus hoggarensis]
MMQIGLTVGVLEFGSGSTLAWMLLAGTVPGLLVGPLAGAVVDHRDARRVASIGLAVQAAMTLSMGLFLEHSLVAVACCHATASIAGRFPPIALQRLRYAVLDESRWTTANAAVSRIMALTLILGALLGSAGVTVLGIVPTFAAAAAMAALAAALVWTVPGETARPAAAGGGLRLGGGLAALRRHPSACAIVVLCTAWGLIGGGLTVLLGILGADLTGDGRGVGVLLAVYGAGLLLGTLGAGRLAPSMQSRANVASYLVQGFAWAAVAPLGALLLPVSAVLFVMGVVGGVIIGLEVTLLLRDVPRDLHGRVLGIYLVADGASGQLSLALIGAALGIASAPTVIAVGGLTSVVVTVLAALVMRAPRKRGRRRPAETGV